MNHRIAGIVAALCVSLPMAALAQDYDFQDTSESIHFADSSAGNGPGIFSSTHAWTGFLFPNTYINNGVTLDLSGFPFFAIPNDIVGSPDPYLGTPAFVLSQSLADNQAVSFSLSNIPAAPAGMTYDLVLYSTNFQADAGTAFALNTGSGAADQGISATINAPDPGQTTGPDDIFREGVNYVVFDNVVPAGGFVGITATPLSTEVDLNAVQLVAVAVPEPGTLTLAIVAVGGLTARRRR